MVYNHPKEITENEDEWLKAAVIGSIWASFEVVFGYFFHNLRLPFAGSFLTFWGIALMASFAEKWSGKRLFIKAGIISAIMRSMTPTSVILGPVIGIMLESVIFQTSINLLGKNILSYSVAGILSMLAAIMHKLVSILLIYGFDVVKVVENFYLYLQKVSGIELSFYNLLLLVLSVYVAFGILSGITGQWLGNTTKTASRTKHGITLKKEKTSIFDLTGFTYNIFWLVLHLVVPVTVLFMLYLSKSSVAFIVSSAYFVAVVIRYGKRLKRILKPVFWIQLAIVFVLTLLFWNNSLLSHQWNNENIYAGIKIVFRALVLITAFSAIGIELKNPVVKILLAGKGARGLYYTLELAVSVLPYLIKNLSGKKIFVNPVKAYREAIIFAEELYMIFKEKYTNARTVYIITGQRQQGKTHFLSEVIKLLKEKGLDVCGIISKGIDKNGIREGFVVKDIKNGKEVPLCNRQHEHGDLKVGRFYFKQEGLLFGIKVLDKCRRSDIIIIDEIGPAELKGKGWYEILENFAYEKGMPMIWVVRRRLVEKIVNLFPSYNYKICDIEKCSPEELISGLL